MRKLISFVVDYWVYVLKGGPKFYGWLGFLCLVVSGWLYGNFIQLSEGMIVTGLTDQVSWGLYLANFVFLVGVAAGAVTVVFPAYVYKHEALHEVTVLGEMLAISAVIMCMLFVLNHMGRPDRLWHMIPMIGIYNWPGSMLTWDVIVLCGYLLLNVVGGFYYLYKKYTQEPLAKGFYLPIIYIAIVWALSIHTVTAFLINTMPARPMWHHGMMPIKFISTAFAAGPALIIVVFTIVRNNTKFWIKDEAFDLLSQIIVWCLGIALFLTLSEVVTEFYHPGLNALVPWFWFSMAAMIGSFILLLIPSIRRDPGKLPYICAVLFLGIWVEKGMGLLIPGSIPTPIGEFTQYSPTFIEIVNCLGNWAIGFIVLTLLLKGAIGVLLGEVKYASE